MKKNPKILLLIIGAILFIIGFGLLVWSAIGQVVAQINFDGQYLSWRMIKDVSMCGILGIFPCTAGACCIALGK